MSILERRVRDRSSESYFLKYARDVTSQNGEDGIFERIFELIGTSENPYCIDVGAWDGVHLSNTYNFLKNKNWGGILFEADDKRCDDLKSLYKNRHDIICVNSLVALSGDNSLGEQLNKYNIALDVDFITIDIDGADYHLWKGIGTSYQPRVVCIEFNPTVPNDVYFIQEADTRIQQGSSLLAINELGISLGYTLVCTTIFNAIFIRNDFIPLIPNFNMDIDILHTPEMGTEVFQTYDGELKFCGSKKLLWHKLAMNPQKLQVLEKKSRKFPFAATWDTKLHELRQLSYDFIASLNVMQSVYFRDTTTSNEVNTTSDVVTLSDTITTSSTLFTSLLTSASHLLVIQFLEGIVVDTLQNTLQEVDLFVSILCFAAHNNTQQRSDLYDSNFSVNMNNLDNSIMSMSTPTDTNNTNNNTNSNEYNYTNNNTSTVEINNDTLISFAITLHTQVSALFETRGDALINSNLPLECKEWYTRAVNTLNVEWQHNIADITHKNATGSIRTTKIVKSNTVTPRNTINDMNFDSANSNTLYNTHNNNTESSENMTNNTNNHSDNTSHTSASDTLSLVGSNIVTLRKVTSLHDYLVLYSEVVDKVQAHTLSDGARHVDTQLHSVALQLKIVKLCMQLEQYSECSVRLSQGMAVLCDLAAKSNGSTPNSPAQRSSYTNSSTVSQHNPSEPYTTQQATTLQHLIQAHWKSYRKYFTKLSEVRGEYLNALERQVGASGRTVSTVNGEKVKEVVVDKGDEVSVLKVNSSTSQPDVKSVVEKQIKTAKTKRSKASLGGEEAKTVPATFVVKQQDISSLVEIQQVNRKLQLEIDRERRLAESYREENETLHVWLFASIVVSLGFLSAYWMKK